MGVMVILKRNKESEAGVMLGEDILAQMGKYNEQRLKSGVMLEADRLLASAKGKRVRFSGDQSTVIDAPFSATKELISGYWLWQVRSIDEAVEMAGTRPRSTEEQRLKSDLCLMPVISVTITRPSSWLDGNACVRNSRENKTFNFRVDSRLSDSTYL